MENLQDTNKPVACHACTGSGRMVRDPDIGTDQECFACEGSGVFEDTTPSQRKPMTDDEIKEAVLDDTFGGLALLSMMRDEVMIADVCQAINRIARAIEAAHGIKGEA